MLYDRVSRAVDKKAAFKVSLKDMKRTLESLKEQAGVIREIEAFNVELSLRNDAIDDLRTQMIEGSQLICRLSGVGGIITYCCTSGCAEQLDELNRRLESLLGNLRLQHARDIKEILKYVRKSDDDLDELKQMVKRLLSLNEKESKETSASETNTENEGNGEKQGSFLRHCLSKFYIIWDFFETPNLLTKKRKPLSHPIHIITWNSSTLIIKQ